MRLPPRLLLLAATTFAGLGGVAGCAADTASSSDDITKISQTRVKEQAVGNCWIYATLGWVESLELGASHRELNLSESYVTYMHWFQRITTGKFLFDNTGAFSTGDFYGMAAEIIARYGLMDEAAFLPSERALDRSARQEQAVAKISAAVAVGGALDTPAKRADKSLVRKTLDDAFGIGPTTQAKLTKAFGSDFSKIRGKGANLSGKGFRDPAKLVVAHLPGGTELTLDDALGQLDPDRPQTTTRDRMERRGKYAWQRVGFGGTATARAATILRLKQTLNRGFAAPIDWYVANRNQTPSVSFEGVPGGAGGWHTSLLHDYQATIPGYGTLPVGVPVTDAAILAKTLAPTTTIDLLRFKNSWGRDPGPADARGYTDVTWEYLTSNFTRASIDYDERPEVGVALDAVILPPATWDAATP